MAVKVTLDPTQGLVQSSVSDGASDAAPSGFSPHRLPVTVLTANTTLGPDAGGVYVVSSSTAGAKTLTLPLASAAPGMLLAIRAGSGDAHVITASQELNGKLGIAAGGFGANNGGHGSSVTLEANISSSVSMLCDGASWLVLGASGSLTIAGT